MSPIRGSCVKELLPFEVNAICLMVGEEEFLKIAKDARPDLAGCEGSCKKPRFARSA